MIQNPVPYYTLELTDNNGNLLAQVAFKPDFKNESNNEIGQVLHYFDPRTKIIKVKIPKINEPFDLFFEAINPNLVNPKTNTNNYELATRLNVSNIILGYYFTQFAGERNEKKVIISRKFST